MRCPFLEEVVVRYCTAYPVKKMIPATDLDRTGVCSGDFQKCPVFRDWDLNRKEEKMEKSAEKLCIWAKLGVVSYRLCTQDYNCASCEFDHQMSSGKYGESALVLQAMERLRSLPAEQRVCRYMLTGDLSYKICSNNYECYRCEVDQQIQDRLEYHPVYQRRRKIYHSVAGFNIAPALIYTRNHFWILKISKTKIRVGLDDLAQALVGDIKGVDYEDHTLKLESDRGTFELNPGITGKNLRINPVIRSRPELINANPYRNWIIEIENPRYGEVERVESDAEVWLKKELESLAEFTHTELETVTSDGAHFSKKLLREIDPELRSRLVDRFLKGGKLD